MDLNGVVNVPVFSNDSLVPQGTFKFGRNGQVSLFLSTQALR